ncbi:MAG: hypothetical protein V4622_00970 [Bacteroidota bacterium]
MTKDFESQNLKYKSYGFGEVKALKPASFFVLDSLYEKKYLLEQQGRIDKKLEERIANQKNIIYNDTSSIYYIENHVFAVERDSIWETFHAEIYCDQANKINTVKILESGMIDRKLIDFYTCYKFKQSFLYPHMELDEAEKAFYDFYGQYLERLEGKDKEEFQTFMLTVMKTANKINTLDKSELIIEFVRIYIQGQSRNYLDEKVEKMDEVYDEKNVLTNYYVEYQFSSRNEDNSFKTNKVAVILDPYLRFVETRNR